MGKFSRRRRGKRRSTSKLRDKRINTLFEKRAKEIAQVEDKKNKIKYVHETQIKLAAYNWNSTSILPSYTNWSTIVGGAISYDEVSDLGQNVALTEMIQLDVAHPVTGVPNQMLELAIHGIQVKGIVKNNSAYPMRVECRLIFIPNLNQYTVGAVDYLVPRFTMFAKSGQGTGNLLFNGYNRRQLAANTASGIPIKFTTLDRKVFHLPGASMTGTLTDQAGAHLIAFTLPPIYKRFSMSKYFKTAKKGFVRSQSVHLSNGAYYFVRWSDSATMQQTVSLIADCLLQYSIKAPMHSDLPAT